MSTTSYQLNGKQITLSDTDVIGVGGEATVFRHNGQAIKLYIQPSKERDQKLRAFLAHVGNLPADVIAPQALVFDSQGQRAVGFSMRLLDANYTELRQLANKKYRATAGVTACEVAELFLRIHATLTAIHRAGMVVGDFNDLNVMFKGGQVCFIDVDSFQFGAFPCPVGTEAFIDPILYGVDFSKGPQFRQEHDWYAFAVLLFKALLLAHPYGGVHPALRTLPKRAAARISVLNPDVTYPRIAYPPDLLTNDLAAVFRAWFDQGQRGVFPVGVLQDYIAALRACPNCAAAYPATQTTCPMCAQTVPARIPHATQVATLLEVDGGILLVKATGTTIRLLAQEAGKVVYYRVRHGRQPERVELFNVMPHASYALLDDWVVVSPSRESDDVMIVDTSTGVVRPVLQTITARFGGVQPMFGAGARAIYRVAGNFLMRGRIENDQLIETALMAVTANQTWFQVNPTGEEVFGYFRIFEQRRYWLLVDDGRHDVDLPPLAAGEVLIGLDVKFSGTSILVARRTQRGGTEQVRLDELDRRGRHLGASHFSEPGAFAPLDAHAYAPGMVLSASDDGLQQLRLGANGKRIFDQTAPVVQQGDLVMRYDAGVVVVSDRRVRYLTI